VDFSEETEDNGWLVVTGRGLGIVNSDGVVKLGHTDWLELERISLKLLPDVPRRGAAAWLTIFPISQLPAVRVLLPNAAKRIASLINERMAASVVTTERCDVPGGTVRGALRRSHDDQLEVQVIVPPDIDGQAPPVQAAVLRLGERLSEAAGGLSRNW